MKNKKEIMMDEVEDLLLELTGELFRGDGAYTVSNDNCVVINVDDYMSEYEEAQEEGHLQEYVKELLLGSISTIEENPEDFGLETLEKWRKIKDKLRGYNS